MENPVTFKLTYGKKTYEITFESSSTIADLRKEVETVTGVHPHMQKLLFKGVLKDEQTLKDAKIKDGVKVMLMASKLEDVLQSITAPTTSAAAEAPTTKSVDKVAWCEKTEHKKIIDKGKPDDAEEGIFNKRMSIPPRGVTSLWNQRGIKTRLTFKNDVEELWIGTAERTQKVRYGAIKNVTSEPITSMPQYHIMALQLGPTEKSNYYLYFVPAQYVEAIKDQILGTWRFAF